MDEGNLDVRHLVVLIIFGLVVGIALILLPKVWRMEADVQRDEATKKWWPFGEALREGFVRSLPVGILAALFLELATTAAFFEKLFTNSGRVVAGRFALGFAAVFLALLIVDACVTLFNWPKFAVPPAARDETGAIALWWRGRKYRRSRRSAGG